MSEPAPLTPEQWARVRLLFEQALAQAAGERQAYVQASGEPAEVQAEVLSLLLHTSGGQGGFLAPGSAFAAAPRAAVEAAAPAPAPAGPPPSRIGQRLGAWALEAPLGTGGMGEVFLARRADGAFDGEAAVKVLKRGMDSATVLKRFAQEQQALARLAHPHIARLFDAGLTPDGVPYFVMELVRGQHIDQACAGLQVAQRLGLFLQLADAVSHAHRHLLVHRDLKPANVLVDEAGQVKLLDFGIAKALDPADAGATADTAQRPFTPLYASPEQVRGEPVGTGTDIYSLGVLLYQLLTGQRPYGREASTPLEAARAVLEEQPTRPSRLTPPGADPPDRAWITTRRRLQGDLDNILLKALEKPSERRYPSVDTLAADLRAHLAGLPVSARAPSLGYVAQKFVLRHKLPVALAGLGVLALAGGLGATAWQAREARLARDAAQARLADARSVMHDLVFRFADGVAYLPGGMQVKQELLQDTLASLQRLAQHSGDDPAVLSDLSALHARLAELEGNDNSASLDQPLRAKRNADAAIALGRRALPQRGGDWRFVNWLSRAYVVRAQLLRGETPPQVQAALAALDEAVAVLDKARASEKDDEGRVWLLGGLGSAHITAAQLQFAANQPSLNQPQAALARFAQAQQVYEQLLALGPTLKRMDDKARAEEPKAGHYVLHQLATIAESQAHIHLSHDELAQARGAALAAVSRQREVVQQDPKAVNWRDGWMAKNNTLALVLLRSGDAPGALFAAQRAREAQQALAASEGPNSRWAQQVPHILALQHGRALAATGRHAEALALYQPALPYFTQADKAAKGQNPVLRRRLGGLHTLLSRSQWALGRKAEAREHADAALAVLRPLAQGLSAQAAGNRDVQVLLAEALAWGAQLQPPAAQALKQEALAAYDKAAAVAPLQADNLAGQLALKG